MVSAFQDDIELLPPTATFDEGDDGNGDAVDIPAASAYLIEVAVNLLDAAALGNADNVLDVSIEFSDDDGGTWRQGLVMPQITNASVITNGQKVYYGIAIAPITLAGSTFCQMREVTDVVGTTPDMGTVRVTARGLDLPSRSIPTGIIGYDPKILPTRLQA